MKWLSSITVIALFPLLALTACESAKEELGLTRQAPDEFAVIKRAPLEMPPDYSLRPPRPGMARPQEAQPEKQAKAAVFGDGSSQQTRTQPGGGESALLQKAGSQIAQPGIRARIDHETAVLEPKDKPVAEKLLGWSMGGDEKASATIVDAKGEAERLKKNADEGKPVTSGETPTIEE